MSIRLLLIGSRELSVRVLDASLGSRDVELVGVVPSSVDAVHPGSWHVSLEAAAQARGAPILKTRTVNNRAFLAVAKELRPDVLLSVFYDRILRAPILELPTLAPLNLHFSALPRCRGVFPIPWSLVHGHEAGATLHIMDTGIDTGAVVGQARVSVAADDTARTLYDRVTDAAAELFTQQLPQLIERRLSPIPQDAQFATAHAAGYPNDRWIDWNMTAAAIDRLVRALTFPPFPTSRTAFKGVELMIHHPVAGIPERLAPGVIARANGDVMVGTSRESLRLSDVSIGGQRMSAGAAADLLGLRGGEQLDNWPWTNCHPASEPRELDV